MVRQKLYTNELEGFSQIQIKAFSKIATKGVCCTTGQKVSTTS